MKYDFDTIIDRVNDKYSFAVKWQSPDYILDSLNVKKKRKDLICLETADMDYKTAPEVVDDLVNLAKHGVFGYSHITEEYKNAVISWYKRRQNWEFKKEDIFYFPGTHEAINQIVRRYTKENEGVIILTPCYGYHGDVEPNNRKYITVPLINNNEYFTINYESLEKVCSDKNNVMIIMCHPHNPTGRVFNHEELNKVADICRRNNVLIVSDEVHSDILRKGQVFEPMIKACGPKGIITCTAVNKTFNLAGLAMTNVIIQDDNLKDNLKDYFVLPSPFGVQAVISCYQKGEAWVNALNDYTDDLIKECLDYIKANLPKAKVTNPEGGYSIYIDFSNYGLSEEKIIKIIYEDAGVVLNSGLFFDDVRGKFAHRACLASPKKVCIEALKRIAEQLK